MYSIGDEVRILPRKGSAEDYPDYYVTPMTSYVDQIAIIIDKEATLPGLIKNHKCRKYWNGDIYRYTLNIDEGKFSWRSCMFELVGKPEEVLNNIF